MKNQFKEDIPHKTIEEHLKIVPSRYALACGVSRRVKQLLLGAKPGPHVNPALLRDFKNEPLPYGRAIKVALDEVLKGDIVIGEPTNAPLPPVDVPNQVIFQ